MAENGAVAVRPSRWLETLGEADSADSLGLSQLLIQGFERKREAWALLGVPTPEVEALYSRITSRIAAEVFAPYALLRACLEAAVSDTGPAFTELRPDDTSGHSPPRWSFGLQPLDAMLEGGGYGYTALVAADKVGKSMLAIGAAVEAARAGWRVVYLNAELSPYSFRKRLTGYCCGRPSARVCDQLAILTVLRGMTTREIADELQVRVVPGDERVLIVFDSCDRIARMSSDYLRQKGRWSEFCRLIALHSGGAVSALAIHELGASGADRGQNAAYAADCVVQIRKTSDPEDVEIRVLASRDTAAGDLGLFWRDWRTGVFRPHRQSVGAPSPSSAQPPEDL